MQLDFDLHRAPEPAKEPERKILSVTELTRTVRGLLENKIGQVWVEGEISNHRKQASGHQYFTLKDQNCQLPCVLFASHAPSSRTVRIADGQQVCVLGDLTVYEARGQYQLIVRLVQARGEGALQAKFEALKQKLAAEGLLDSDRKRPLPQFPKRVGVVTSPTGAALHDFLNVLHRRHPGIDVLINPVRVQGAGASREIAQAIREFSAAEQHGLPAVDIIVVTRGGGSIEDLWEFNEEIVARAIAASTIPVVSAIGHEIDFTIADFVADLRAPTPSAAAELLSADRLAVLERLRRDAVRLDQIVRGRLDLLASGLRALLTADVLREPTRRVMEFQQTVDRLEETLHRTVASLTGGLSQHVRQILLQVAAHSPENRIAHSRLHLRWLDQKLAEGVQRQMTALQTRAQHARSVLTALSPNKTIERGYTITVDAGGKPLTKAAQIKVGMTLRTKFADGEIESVAAKR